MTEATTEIVEEATQTTAATQQAETAETTTTQTAETGTTQETTAATTTEETTTQTEAKKENPWGDDWRERMLEGAGKDAEDLRKTINRYGSPNGLARALLAAQREITTRGLAKPKPTDPADEKGMAEWRKSVGIPDDPTGYKLPEEVVKSLTDDDKPVLAQFTEFAHKKGMTPDGVATATEWYLESKRLADEETAKIDAQHKDEADDRLRSEWSGAEYKGNMSLARRFVEDHLGINYQEYAGLRLSDGRRLGNIPELLMKLSDAGRNAFGDASFVTSDSLNRHVNRMTEIETIMKTDIDRYFREKLDVEYRGLLETDAKRKK